jgi:tetratricopeptide (TPR) repeat protein
MFLLKKLVKIGIISLLLQFNSAPVTAIAQLQPISKQKHSSFRNTFIAASEKEKRTALVIGNSNYQETGQLPNPVNDATDMAQVLRELGFDVILLKDANLSQMGEALDEFHAKLLEGGVGVFYYAGHGMQLDSENYLIPIDAKLERKQDTPYEAQALGKILGAMEDAANNVNIIIIDACRNKPFNRGWQRSSQAEGLAPVQAVRGSYIAYATAPGDVADDGKGRNGTFTAQILKHIKTPNLSVEEMFKRVRQGVLEDTNNQQIPWDSSSLVGEFSFNQRSTPVADTQSTPVATFTPAPESTTSTSTPAPDVATSTPVTESTTPTSTPASESAEKLVQQGLDRVEQGDNQGAIDNFTEGIALNPDDAEAYNNRGEAYRNLRQYQEAIADLDRAISLNPDFAAAYNNRANAYLSLQQYQSAIADFNQVISLNPDYANAYNNRGVAYLNLQQYQEAIADFNKAIALNPDFAAAYNSRGNTYYYLQQYQEAIADFNKAIALNPNYAQAYYNRANAYLSLKQYPKVLADYNKAIELNPNYAEAYYNRGATYSELKQYPEAIADLEKATQLFCQQGNANCQKAQEILRQLQTDLR